MKHILYIEDDLIDRLYLKRLCNNAGLSIQTANNLESAKKMLEEESYDLLIADFYLPDGVVWELLPLSCPLAILSGEAVEEELEESVQSVRWFRKPMKKAQLLALCRNEEAEEEIAYDLKYLEEMGGPGFVQDMKTIFLEETPQDLEVLKTYVGLSERRVAAAKLLHKLKSRFRLLGCKALFEELESEEMRLKKATGLEALVLREELLEGVQKVMQQIRES